MTIHHLPLRITPTSVRYQRNGICGVGFYAVGFDWFDPDAQTTRHMVGFLVPPNGQDEASEAGPAHRHAPRPEVYGVIDPAAPRECWRGDHFADAMFDACQRAAKDGSAYA